MKKILTLFVSVLLSLSFLVPLLSLSKIDVFAAGAVSPNNPCDAYDNLNSSQRSALSTAIGSYNIVLYNAGFNYLFASNGTVTGSYPDFKVTGTIYYYDSTGKKGTWPSTSLGADITNSDNYIFKYKHTGSGTQLLENFTFSSSACVVNTYLITAYAESGGSVTGGGSYTSKQTVTLTAIPDDGYRFKQWSDGNTENPRSFVPTSDLTLIAEFEEIVFYNLNLDYIGIGQVIGSGQYEGGSEVIIEALPGTHYYFEMWSDGNTENPRTLVLNENLHLTAVFFEDPKYQINVEIFGNGSVTGTGSYYGDTEVMLSAVPDEGWYFKSWNDGSIDPVKVINVTRDITFAAVFEEKKLEECVEDLLHHTAYQSLEELNSILLFFILFRFVMQFTFLLQRL